LTSLGSAFALMAFSGVALAEEGTAITPSPDKYTWYIKDYRGLNAASVGYTSLGGERLESYGAGHLELIYVANDGTYIDINDEEQLKNYKIYAQNLEPNTEMKYGFMVDSKGEEYDNLISYQTVEEIVLAVCKVGEEEPTDPVDMTAILPSDDKYTCYLRDYVGRNLKACGYSSLGGDFRDGYLGGSIKLVLTAEDGSYIDPSDSDSLSNYMVTRQSIEPNTQITLTYMTDSDGNEYDNLVQSMSIESVDLYVTQIAASDQAVSGDASADSGEVTADFKEFMDGYETFMNQYCDFMLSYNATVASGDATALIGMLSDYTSMVQQEIDWANKASAVDQTTLSASDLAYYLEVTARVSQRLVEVSAAL
jgi:hypothetical protein